MPFASGETGNGRALARVFLASETEPTLGEQKLSRAGEMDGHPDSTGNPGVNHAWG